MNKRDDIDEEYRSKRRNYEEQEVELRRQRYKAISTLEEVQERSNYYLRDYVPDRDILTQGLRNLDHMKEDILVSSKEEQKELVRNIDELDVSYRSQLRNVENDKEEKSIG